MSRRSPRQIRLTVDQRDAILRDARDAGLDHLGVCTARSWTSSRRRLEDVRSTGLAADMEFTFRNPARSADPTRILRGASSLVVAAMSYRQQEPDDLDVATGPMARVARYATADFYGRLRDRLDAVAAALRALGARAVVVADENALVDREAAWRAGLGWYGKNSLLLVPGEGSWFVLGSVVTDAVVPPTDPPISDGCGGCTRCIQGCPTAAIVAPGVVDARRCLAWLLQAPGPFPVEFRSALGDRLYGCDDCQEVCPPNRTVSIRARRGPNLPVESEPGMFVGAVELLGLDDDRLLARCDRWYVPGRDVTVVRRNLLVILGNELADHERLDHEGRSRVAACLSEYAAGDDPLLAEHARWALEQGSTMANRRTALAGDRRTDED